MQSRSSSSIGELGLYMCHEEEDVDDLMFTLGDYGGNWRG